MPAQTAAVNNPANIVFTKGYLFGTIANGQADDVPFAELQEISFKSTLALKQLMGPEQLTPIGVGISEHSFTGTAKYGKVRARQFQMLRGGTATTSAGVVTTLNIGVAQEPLTFNLHLKTPSDGSDFEMKVFGCISTDLNLQFTLNDFVIPDFTFNAYGDGTNIAIIILPGAQISS